MTAIIEDSLYPKNHPILSKESIIQEFVETEGHHVMKLITVRDIFHKPALAVHQNGVNRDELSPLFLNYEKFIDIHSEIYEKLFIEWSELRPLDRVFYELFNGSIGSQLEVEMGYYCANFSLDTLRTLRNDPKLDFIFSPARQTEMHATLSKNTIEDLLASVFQRPMKYPLLLERLLNTLKIDSKEYECVEMALKKCREILTNVNHTVMQKNFRIIFGKTIQKDNLYFNINGKTVIHLGLLKWKLSCETLISVCLVLTKKEIVILEAKQNYYVLRQYRKPNDLFVWFEPILQLKDSLARDNACEPKSFYLLSNEQKTMFEFLAPSTEERNRWTQLIATASRMLSKNSLETVPYNNELKRNNYTINDIVGHHPDLEITVGSGRTPLHVACLKGSERTVKLFLENGADFRIQDDDGNSAIHYAVFGRNAKVLKLLLDHKADVNALNAKKRSALHIAVIMGDLECVKILTANHCDVNQLDLYSNTPLDYSYKLCGLFEKDTKC